MENGPTRTGRNDVDTEAEEKMKRLRVLMEGSRGAENDVAGIDEKKCGGWRHGERQVISGGYVELEKELEGKI